MKRWTWLAVVAATSACGFPTGEFTVGTTRLDVPVVDTGSVDTGSPIDQGTPGDQGTPADQGTPTDQGMPGDVVDAGAPGDVVVETDVVDAGEPGDIGTPDDAGTPDDVPPVDGGCVSPTISCTVAGASACVNPLTTIDHCGRCNYQCNNTNATAACTDGRCVLTCNAGFADCDGDPRNGCEVGLNTITNCRVCGDVCPSGAALNGTVACTAGMCGITCATGYGNCNNMVADGCETPTASNTANCGMCGRACAAGQSCVAGACTTVCTAPSIMCSGACVDGQTSTNHCNGCGNVCPAPPNAAAACRAGMCGQGICNAGFGDCVAATAGCETPLNTTANCGACGRACAFPNATAMCVAGACVMGSCTGTFRDCDSNPSNGCETDTSTNGANCGACGTTCRTDARTNGACVSSRCTCNAGYADCNGMVADGCEVSNATNLNCGSCRAACTGSTACTRGTLCSGPAPTPTYVRSAGPAYLDVCGNAAATRILGSQDDAGFLVPLPFNFTLWGTAVGAGSMINVASNGFISLQPTVANNLLGIIPDPAAPNAVIAAWWTDLVTSPVGVCTLTLGLAPNRRFYVQWSDVDYYSGRTGDMNFEIVLSESSNTVDIVYGRIAAPPTGYFPTVGLENNNGTSADIVCLSTTTSCAIASGTSIHFTPR